MAKQELAVINACPGSEAQLAKLRTQPDYEKQWRPTVAMVIYNIVDHQVVLCTSRNRDPLDLDGLHFPQEGIHCSPAESVARAHLRGAYEEFGLDAFASLHELGGEALAGKRQGKRRKMLFPMLGVVEGSPQLTINPAEMSGADWYDLDYAEKVIDAQPDERRCRNARAILQQLITWTGTADLTTTCEPLAAELSAISLATAGEPV